MKVLILRCNINIHLTIQKQTFVQRPLLNIIILVPEFKCKIKIKNQKIVQSF